MFMQIMLYMDIHHRVAEGVKPGSAEAQLAETLTAAERVQRFYVNPCFLVTVPAASVQAAQTPRS